MKSLTIWIAVLLWVVFFSTPLGAAEIEWSHAPFQHISENQPIDGLLKDLFLSQGLIVSISDAVKGETVSGKFNQPPRKVFQQLTSTFDLIWYFDGHIIYIYRANEVENATIALQYISPLRFKQILNQMMITDERFPLRCYPTEKMVLAFGPKAYVNRVKDTAKLVDTPRNAAEEAWLKAMPPIIRVFRLKHAWAEDQTLHFTDRDVVIKGVATILRDLINNNKKDAVKPSRPAGPALYLQPGKGTVYKVPLKNHMEALKAVTYIPNEQIAGDQSITEDDSTQKLGTGGTIQSSSRVNAVIVKDTPINMVSHEKLIAELDVPLQLIEIQASIIDVDNDAVRSLGVEWQYASRKDDFGLDITSDTIPSGAGSSFLPPQADNPGGLNLNTIIGNMADGLFLARLHALEEEGKATVISRPSIITFDNIEAQFTHTNTFYVRVASTENANLFQVSTGIILKVTPHVINEQARQKIQLVVNIEDGNIKDRNVDDIPVVENSTINTQAVVDENESLLVGGLIYDIQTKTQVKVPVLGEIPLLGHLFRYKKDTKSRQERMFLISPRIITVDSRNQAYARNHGIISGKIASATFDPDAPLDRPNHSGPNEIQIFSAAF